MNIGNVGTNIYNGWTRRVNQTKAKGNESFGNVNGNQGASTHMVLHGVSDEMKEQGYTCAGSWADAVSGTSAAVYKPKDFDENNPMYLLKVWDAEGNVTEREVEMNEVDPQNSDAYEMYAYSCYLGDSGKYPNATTRFIQSIPPRVDTEQLGLSAGQFGLSSLEDVFSGRVNWLSVIKGWMDMQFGCGNMKGYLDYKGFYDFLA